MASADTVDYIPRVENAQLPSLVLPCDCSWQDLCTPDKTGEETSYNLL